MSSDTFQEICQIAKTQHVRGIPEGRTPRQRRHYEIMRMRYNLTSAKVKSPQTELIILADAAGRDPLALRQEWAEAARLWTDHPDFDWFCDNRIYDGHDADPMKCQMAAIYTHPPGKQDRTESIMFGSLGELVLNLAWCEYMLGRFSYLERIDHGFRVSDFPLYGQRTCHVSNSYLGSGKAYGSRMELKRWLPRKFSYFISSARRSKRDSLGREVINPATGQKWHNYKTKKDKFIFHDCPNHDAELWQELTKWISHSDFWDCATGKHEPHLVRTFITHQPDLGLLADIPKRKRRRPESQPESQPESLDNPQLSLDLFGESSAT